MSNSYAHALSQQTDNEHFIRGYLRTGALFNPSDAVYVFSGGSELTWREVEVMFGMRRAMKIRPHTIEGQKLLEANGDDLAFQKNTLDVFTVHGEENFVECNVCGWIRKINGRSIPLCCPRCSGGV